MGVAFVVVFAAAGSMVADSMVAAGSTVAAAASTAAVVFMVEADFMAVGASTAVVTDKVLRPVAF